MWKQVLVIAAAVAILGGCAREASKPAPPPPATQEEAPQKPVPEVKEDPEKVARLQQLIKENYGPEGLEASWFTSLKAVRVWVTDEEDQATVETSIWPDNEGKALAKSLCRVILLLGARSDSGLNLKGVQIQGEGGASLRRCHMDRPGVIEDF